MASDNNQDVMDNQVDLVTQEFMIPGPEKGIELYIRNKRPRDLTGSRPENTLLFVHGATYPAEHSFDLSVDGTSWMEYIAAFGFDVYLVNVRGYGKSTRPPEMEVSSRLNKPIVRTETAVADFTAAADFILKRRKIRCLNVMGWSWGSVIAARYTVRNPNRVKRLVLHAPVWTRETNSLIDDGKPIGAYRKVTPEDALKRWNAGIPNGKKAVPKSWQDAWLRANFASDPVGSKAKPKYLRAPNGVIQDIRQYWTVGKPMYKASDIEVPTLIVVGSWDVDTPPYMAQTLFPALTNASPKRMVTIGEGTHMMMLEKSRMTMFREVQLFLGEAAE